MYMLIFWWLVDNIPFGHTSYWYFALYLSGAYNIPPLSHGYIHVFINICVNVIPMRTAIHLCTLYNLLLGCATSWTSCHTYFLYIIEYSIVIISVELHSQNWINTLLFDLVVTCIKRHIFVSTFSISPIYISIIIFFHCFLLL